ncbi:MAG: prepilin peptidase [Lachnospiraceae bacterium]|nr:prepilin peptidase [Lachnospiraceae bacterium]
MIGILRIIVVCESFDVVYELLNFLVHVFGTCAVLYILFLRSVLGAGDVKLMAVIVGFHGVEQGIWIIGCGLLLALIVESLRANVKSCGYHGLNGIKVRLAPYLFLGYWLFCLFIWERG